jgi:tungstate transport system substrate-binding protein
MFKKTRFWAIMLIVLMMASVIAGCGGTTTQQPQQQSTEQKPAETTAPAEKTMTLATTTSTQDSGLLEVLLPAFEKKEVIKVKVVAVGSGAAMEMGKKGDADVLLVHSPKAEKEFMDGGFGDDKKSVMHNEYFIVGPANDPAKIKGVKTADEAIKAIAASKSIFISRGDNSGTHTKEKGLWEKAKITPEGTWYVQAGQGMGATLTMAQEKGGYTLTDSATFLSQKDKLKLVIMVRGDTALANPYSVITVSKIKFPQIHFEEAAKFAEFITSAEGLAVITEFGKDKYGEPLFISDVK